jgi:gliding motility-associated-like protein
MNRLNFFISNALMAALWLAVPTAMQSQLVMNGGFESISSLPNNTGQWSFAEYWSNASSATGDPDLFHIEGAGGGDLPETPVAIIAPFQGMAIAGFMACGAEGTNRREYWTGQFSEALVPGQRYQMTLAIANGERTPFSEAGLGVSGLGMHFSEGVPMQNELEPLDLNAQFEFPQVLFGREWQALAFAFTAQDPYTHFTWGVFGSDDQHSIVVQEGSGPSMAYYFVDGFEITVIDGEMENEENGSETRGPVVKPEQIPANLDDAISWFVPNAFTPNGDGENDLFMPVLRNMELIKLEVFNRWGEQMWMTEDPSTMGWNGMHVGEIEVVPGAYVWKLQMRKSDGQLMTKSGSLNLIR